MARHGKGQIIARHAAAVICDTDQHLATGSIVNRDTLSPRVQRVFDQFFHRRGGAFHHLASCDPVDRRFIQQFDFWTHPMGGLTVHSANCSRDETSKPQIRSVA